MLPLCILIGSMAGIVSFWLLISLIADYAKRPKNYRRRNIYKVYNNGANRWK